MSKDVVDDMVVVLVMDIYDWQYCSSTIGNMVWSIDRLARLCDRIRSIA